MRFWNYVGEFFLFRWLFSSHKHNEKRLDISDTTSSQVDKDFAKNTNSLSNHRRYDDDFNYHHNDYQYYGYTQSVDDFLDEQEGYDMLDDDF